MNKTMHIFSITLIVCVAAIKATKKLPLTIKKTNESLVTTAPPHWGNRLFYAIKKYNTMQIKKIVTQHMDTIKWFQWDKNNPPAIRYLFDHYYCLGYRKKGKKKSAARREKDRSDTLVLIDMVLNKKGKFFNKELNKNEVSINTTICKQQYWTSLLCTDQDTLKITLKYFTPETWSNKKLMESIEQKKWWLIIDT